VGSDSSPARAGEANVARQAMIAEIRFI